MKRAMLVPKRTATVLPFSKEQHYLSEGPYIVNNPNDWTSTTLSYVNIQKGLNQPGQLHIVETKDWKHRVEDLIEPAGFAFPTTEKNKYVIGLGKGLAIYDVDSKNYEWIEKKLDDEDVLINDALLVPEGLVFGTKHSKCKEKVASLWFYSYDKKKTVLLKSKLTISNGMDYIVDGHGKTWLVHIDTPDKAIKKYPFDAKAGTIEEKDAKVVVDLTNETVKFPDGMTLSPDKKHLIVAMWNDDENSSEGEARQYSVETGELERIFIVPGAPRVTCPILVKDKVILTTAWEGSEKLKEREPNTGKVFFCETTGDGFNFGEIQESLKFHLK